MKKSIQVTVIHSGLRADGEIHRRRVEVMRLVVGGSRVISRPSIWGVSPINEVVQPVRGGVRPLGTRTMWFALVACSNDSAGAGVEVNFPPPLDFFWSLFGGSFFVSICFILLRQLADPPSIPSSPSAMLAVWLSE